MFNGPLYTLYTPTFYQKGEAVKWYEIFPESAENSKSEYGNFPSESLDQSSAKIYWFL